MSQRGASVRLGRSRVITRLRSRSVKRACCVVTAAALTGCVGSVGQPKSTAPGNCLTATSHVDEHAPVVAVLSGITKNDQSPTMNQERRQAFALVLAAAIRMKAYVVADDIGSGIADARLAINTRLVATGPNDLFKERNLACKQSASIGAFNTLISRPSPARADILSALLTLGEHLQGLPREDVSVVMMSAMVNAVAPLDLSNADALAADPNAVLAQLKSRGLLPDCRGWKVSVVGGGRLTSGSFDDEREVALEQFWRFFFRQCGGELVSWEPQLSQFPVSAQPQPAALSYPAVRFTPLGPDTARAVLPASVLFDIDQAALRPDASPILRQLLSAVTRRDPTSSIVVAGFTDSSGAPDHNLALSNTRAAAVATWLVAHGVATSRIATEGRGQADPIGDNTTAAGRQQNRRVEITIHP